MKCCAMDKTGSNLLIWVKTIIFASIYYSAYYSISEKSTSNEEIQLV